MYTIIGFILIIMITVACNIVVLYQKKLDLNQHVLAITMITTDGLVGVGIFIVAMVFNSPTIYAGILLMLFAILIGISHNMKTGVFYYLTHPTKRVKENM